MTVKPSTLWFDLLKAKYFPNGSPMFASANHGSQLWKDLVRVRDVSREQVKFVVNNGVSTRFGWIGGLVTPLLLLLFLHCFLIALFLRSQSLSSPRITGTWASCWRT